MSSYGDNRETSLTKVNTLSGNDLVRVVASSSSRNITVTNLITALTALGLGSSLNVETTAINLLASVSSDVILCNVTSGGIVVTLPDATTAQGKLIQVKKIDGSTNDVTISSVAGTIDGSASATLSGSGGAKPGAAFVSDGSNWYILNA